MSGEKAFDAASVKLSGPVPWKEWSNRLPKVSYEDLEWREPLGRVPFYMYDDEEWDNMMRVKFQCASTPKVCPEFMFLHQLRFHPWRVEDIKKAAVVVLPIITSDYVLHRGKAGRLNQQEIKARFNQIRRMIDPHKPHLVYIGHWATRDLMGKLNWEPVSDFIVVSQELFHPRQAAPIANPIYSSVLGTMSANGMKNLEAFPSSTATTIDNFRKRKHLFNFLGQADSRRAYYLRTLILKLFSKVREPSVLTLVRVPGTRQRISLPPCDLKDLDETDWKGCHVEQGQLSIVAQDYLMQTSKFVLITRGDNGGSQRIQQAGRLGAMMVIIGRATVQEGLPFHCLIPWKHISYVFPDGEILKDGTALETVLQRINEESNEEFERRFRLYQLHVPDFVWEVENSRVAENVLIEAARRTPPDQLAQSGLSQLDFGCAAGGVDLRFEERVKVMTQGPIPSWWRDVQVVDLHIPQH